MVALDDNQRISVTVFRASGHHVSGPCVPPFPCFRFSVRRALTPQPDADTAPFAFGASGSRQADYFAVPTRIEHQAIARRYGIEISDLGSRHQPSIHPPYVCTCSCM